MAVPVTMLIAGICLLAFFREIFPHGEILYRKLASRYTIQNVSSPDVDLWVNSRQSCVLAIFHKNLKKGGQKARKETQNVFFFKQDFFGLYLDHKKQSNVEHTQRLLELRSRSS